MRIGTRATDKSSLKSNLDQPLHGMRLFALDLSDRPNSRACHATRSGSFPARAAMASCAARLAVASFVSSASS